MPEQRLFIRTDANSKIGLGHLIRTSALAAMLRKDFQITFLLQDTPEAIGSAFIPADMEIHELVAGAFNAEQEISYFKNNGLLRNHILVLDGYQFDNNYQRAMMQLGAKLVYIDDLLRKNYEADLLINQADLVTESNYEPHRVERFCLGPNYALLRQSFLSAARHPGNETETIESAFVSFGGADAGNVTFKAVKALSSIPEIKAIHILSSSVNEQILQWQNGLSNSPKFNFHRDLDSNDVCNLMKQCQLALCPSSSLSLELCAVGIPLLTGTTADNQQGYYRSLTERGAALGIGHWLKVSEEIIKGKASEMIHSTKEKLKQMMSAQRQYIDGYSGGRLLAVFKEL